MDVKGIYFQICTILFNKANNKYLQDVIHLQNPFIPSVAKNHWLGTCAYGRCVLLRHFAAPVAPWLLVSQTWKQIAKLTCMDESLEMMRLSHSEASLKWRFRGLPGQFEAQKLEVLPSGWSQAAFDLKVMALYIRRGSWVFALLIWDSKTIHWGKVLSRAFWPWQCMEWFWRASTPSFSTILGVWLEQPGSCFTCGFWMVGAGFLPCRRNSDWRNLEIEVYGSPAFLCRLGLPSPETSSRHIFSNIFFCVPKGFHSNFHLVFRKVS